MAKKPISPVLHGILDYVLGGAILAAPAILKLEEPAAGNYRKLAVNMLMLNALTDSGVGIAGKISLRSHKKADLATLAGLGASVFSKKIRKNKKTLAFHMFLTGALAASYTLTDYKGTNEIVSDATHPEYQSI